MQNRMVWEQRISHEGLKAYRVIRGATQDDVAAKATYQLEIWANRWKRLQVSEENQRRRQQAAATQQWTRYEKEQNIELAGQQTKQLQEELEALESLHRSRNLPRLSSGLGRPQEPRPISRSGSR
jgi:hypothetical protein